MNVMRRPGQGDPSKLMSSGQQRIDDSLQSFVSGLGTWKDPTVQLKFYLKLLNRDEVENAFRGDWIARKIVMAPAEDATREWRAWQANGDQIELIEEEERTHNIQKKTREAIFKARLYGGAGMVIGVDDGKDVIEPLDLDSVKKGDLKFVVVMNRYELAAGPRIYNVNSPWYTYPEYFTVQTPMFGFYGEHGDTYPNTYAAGATTSTRPGPDPTGRGDPARQVTPISGMVRIHPSRVVQFVGNELPDWRLVPLGGLWGDSVLQTIDDILKDFGLTIGSIANMVNDAKMDVIKIPNLSSVHLATQEATSALLSRFGLANQAKSTVNSLLLDAQEEWQRIQSSFGGLPDIMKQFMMLICAGGGVPYSRVFGGQSRGLGEEGSSGAGGGAQDLKGYYDDVSSKQKTVITPAMDRLDQVLLRSALGRFDPNVFYEWSPLYQPDPKEVAAIQLQKAQTTQIYVNLGLINEDVMRTVVINQQIEDGTYPGMEDAVDEYGEEPDEPEGDFDPQSGNVLPGTPTHAAMQQIAPPGGGNAEAQDAAASQRRGYLLGKKSFKQFRQAQIQDSYFSDLQWRAAAAAKGGVIVPGSHGKFFVGDAHLHDVWGPAAWEASAAARAAEKESGSGGGDDQTQRFHLGFKYINPEKGWENKGNAVVHHENIEGAAQQLMAERNIPSMTVTNRYHANGRVDEINIEFHNPKYSAPAPAAAPSCRNARRRKSDAAPLDIGDYWSEAAREASIEARKRADYHDRQAHAMNEKAVSRPGDDRGDFRVAQSMHNAAATSYRNAVAAYEKGDKATAHEMMENAKVNADAAHDYRMRKKLGDAEADDDPELTMEELAINAIYSIAASIDKNDFAAEVMQAETMIYELIAKLAEQHGVTQGSVHEMISALDVVKNDKVVAEAVARWRPPSNVLAT